MTAPASPIAADSAPAAADPHAPKLAPDDPRLRLPRAGARTLRAGPIAVLFACVLGAVLLAVALSFRGPRDRTEARAEPSGAPPAPAIPDAIKNAQAHPPPRPALDAGVVTHVATAGGGAEDPARRLDRELDQKARASGILVEAPGPASESRAPEAPMDRAPTPTPEPTASSPGSAPTVEDPNFQDHKNAFLSGKGGAKQADYLAAAVQHPRSPYEIKAGTLLPAVLITAINSDLPGPVVAQVREHVYDTVTGNTLLVPQGSRLIAQYDSMVAWGQERVLLCWNRLVLPNGDSLDLQCMPAADLQGAAGLTDEVDEHWWRILKGATVATLLAATSTYVAGDTTGFNPTVTQTMARSASGEINQVGARITHANLNIQPTITVRPGFSVNVIVTKDMILSPYPDPPAALGLRP
jgi:type IV secretion system protein VirB10